MKALRLNSSPLVRLVILLFAVSWLTLTSCDCWNDSVQTDQQVEYDAAVQDAKATADAISKKLTAIGPENTSLIWENGVPGTRVLVATWLSDEKKCKSYTGPSLPCKAGQECPKYCYNSWVSVVPELKNLVGKNPTLLRVVQALGLPPPSPGQTLENTCIMQLYVSPAKLFRPTADPDVTRHRAEPFSSTDGFRKREDRFPVYSDMPCDTRYCPSCASGRCGMTSYRNWYQIRETYIYSKTPVSAPYPWTALGFTYDWGNHTPPHFGVSEFVINSGTKGIGVRIESCTWTGDYFSKIGNRALACI